MLGNARPQDATTQEEETNSTAKEDIPANAEEIGAEEMDTKGKADGTSREETEAGRAEARSTWFKRRVKEDMQRDTLKKNIETMNTRVKVETKDMVTKDVVTAVGII